jgi:hypothetical protein
VEKREINAVNSWFGLSEGGQTIRLLLKRRYSNTVSSMHGQTVVRLQTSLSKVLQECMIFCHYALRYYNEGKNKNDGIKDSMSLLLCVPIYWHTFVYALLSV